MINLKEYNMKSLTFRYICCYLFVVVIGFSLSSCEEGLYADKPVNDGLSFRLAPTSFTTKEISTRASTTAFAGALTREQELAVHDLCYFEFAGNQVESNKCLAKGYISPADLSNPHSVRFSGLTGAAGTHTLYLVANLGDVTGSVVADATGTAGTTLSALKELTFAWTTLTSNDGTPYTAGTDFFLPMTGSVTVDQSATYTTPVTTPLQRRVARVNVSVESKTSNFILTDIKLLHVSKNGLYSAATTAYPAAGVSGNFSDASALVDASSAGYHYTWYIPENRRTGNDSYQPALYVAGFINGLAISKQIFITASPNTASAPVAYEILPNYEYGILLNVTSTGISTAIDLSMEASANSYICDKAEQLYAFNATVQGNGVPTPGNDGLVHTTADNNYTPAAMVPNMDYTARVLWSMGGVTPSADTDGGNASTVDDGLYSVIKKGTLDYDATTGYISFETTAATLPAQAGNAVIGLFDSGGTLLWSWHIWFTDYNPDVQYDAYKTAADGHPNPLLMMKYNLGATDQSGALSDIANVYKHGFHYQWGRKDPFLGSAGTNVNCTAGTQYYYNITDGVADFVYDGTSGSLTLGHKKPMTFYTNGSSPYDWQGSTVKNDLWGNPGITWNGNLNSESGIKTCFDPCPPGWKVPSRGTWNAIFATTVVTTNTSATPNQTGGFAMGYKFYYTAVGSGPTAFYPASGYRGGYSPGALYNVSTVGYCWCSSPSSGGSIYTGYLIFNSSFVNPLSNCYRTYGFPVRCTKE